MKHFNFLYLLILPLIFYVGACAPDNSESNSADLGDSGSLDGDFDSTEENNGSSDEKNGCLMDSDCTTGEVCDLQENTCRLPECESDAFCVDEYGIGSYCSYKGICISEICFSSEDCNSDKYCALGYCRPLPTCDRIADAQIFVELPLIRSGQEVHFEAVAYDESGTILPEMDGLSFSWESMNSGVVEIDPQSGDAVGGSVSGTTTVVMRFEYDDPECTPYQLSDTISIQNFAAYEDGARVVIIDAETNQPVGGATVSLNGVVKTTSADIDAGLALFEGLEPPYELHVFHKDYHYLSVVGVEGADILIPLQKYYGPHRAAGIKGKLNFEELTQLIDGDMLFGMVGLASKRSLLDMPINQLFSMPIVTRMPRTVGERNSMILPSNLEFMEPGEDSDGYIAEGESCQDAVAWAWGGYLPAEQLVDMMETRLSDDWSDMSAMLFSSLSFSSNFFHGMSKGISLEMSPMVLDDGSFNSAPYDKQDLNGNGLSDDYIPDYGEFTDLGDSLHLTRPMNHHLTIETGLLPTYGQSHLDGTLLVVGSPFPNGKFVPLGVGVGGVLEDQQTDGAEGDDLSDKDNSGRVDLSFAPYYGGLKDEYVLVSYALPLSSLEGGSDSGPQHSAVIRRFSGKIESVKMPDYLDVVPYASISEEDRGVTVYASAGADFFRIIFEKDGRKWELLVDGGNMEELEKVELTLPIPPEGDPYDLAMSVYAVDLYEGISLDYLSAFNSSPLHRADAVTERVSVYRYNRKK